MTFIDASSPVAVITGGARGVGLAVGQWFLAHGHRIALLDIDRDTLAQTAATLSQPGRVMTLHCDVSDPQQEQDAVNKVEATLGRIDALVNNAGVAVFKPIGETTFAEWRHVLSTNLDGTFFAPRPVRP